MKIKIFIANFTQAHWLFVAIASIFGVIYILITPPLWGFDEVAHFNRAYQIAQGSFVPKVDDTGALDKSMPKSLVELEYYVYGDLMDNHKIGVSFRKDIDNFSTYNILTGKSFSKENQESPIIATYSPVAYIAPSIGIASAKLVNAPIGITISLARLCSLALYVALVGISLKITQNRKIKWLVFVIALMPMSLFQAAMISADGLTIGLSIVFMSIFSILILEPHRPDSRKLLFALFSAAILLPLIKVNYIFLSLGVLFVPLVLFSTKKIASLVKAGVLTLMLIPAIVWSLLTGIANNSAVSPRPDGLPVVASDQIAYVISKPFEFVTAVLRSIVDSGDSYVQSLTSYIGWNEVPLPLVFIMVIIVGIILAGLYAKNEATHMRKYLYILNILAVIGVMSIFGALYVGFNPTGYPTVDGVQGRYFIPFIAPGALLAATYIPARLKLKEELIPLVFGSIVSVCLLASTVYYYLATY